MNERRTLRHFRKAMRVFLALCMVALMVPAVAFAADDVTEMVSANAWSEDVYIEVGNVTPESYYGVDIDAANGHTGSVTTGTITAQGGACIEASGSGSTASLTVSGGIQSTDGGLYAGARNGATAKATVTGDIDAINSQSSGCYAEAVYLDSSGSGTASLDVTGNVNAYAAGVYYDGVFYSTGAALRPRAEGIINLSIDGNLTSNGEGIYIIDPQGTADILVTGTIDGKTAGVVVDKTSLIIDEPAVRGGSSSDGPSAVAGSIVLTVWKIVLNNDGYAAVNPLHMITPQADAMSSDEYAQDKDFEKAIKYIIKVNQPKAGGKVSVTDANGKVLDKSHNFDIAYEGDKVMLNVDLESGYKLLAAYNEDGEKLSLQQDENGNYYIIVPKGGGVNLSVELGETTSDNGSDDPDNPNNPADDSDDEAAPTKVASEGSDLPKTADDATGLLAVASIALAGAALMLAGAARSRKRQLQRGEHIR